MDAGVAEPDAGQSRGQEHLGLGLEVVRVADGAGQVLDGAAQGLQRENVGNRVGSLVGGPVDGVGGARGALVVRDGGPGLERVAEDIQTRRGMDGRGHGAGVERVADAQRGFEIAVGDAGLGFFRHEVEDGGSCGLGTGACRGWDGDQWPEGLGDGEAFAQGGVDKVEKVGLGEDSIQIHQLGRVDDRAAADRQKGIGVIWLCERNGVFHSAGSFSSPHRSRNWQAGCVLHLRAILWLDPHLVINRKLNPLF